MVVMVVAVVVVMVVIAGAAAAFALHNVLLKHSSLILFSVTDYRTEAVTMLC